MPRVVAPCRPRTRNAGGRLSAVAGVEDIPCLVRLVRVVMKDSRDVVACDESSESVERSRVEDTVYAVIFGDGRLLQLSSRFSIRRGSRARTCGRAWSLFFMRAYSRFQHPSAESRSSNWGGRIEASGYIAVREDFVLAWKAFCCDWHRCRLRWYLFACAVC